MAASVSVDKASPVHAKDEIVITCAGLAANDATAYDATKYPTLPKLEYRLFMTGAADPGHVYDLRSQRFGPDANGGYAHLPIVLPTADTWTIAVKSPDGVTSYATTTVTAS